jgi:hypothetical protein
MWRNRLKKEIKYFTSIRLISYNVSYMKSLFTRFIIIMSLVLSSISVCLSNDNGCDDQVSYSKSLNSTSSSQEQSEDHHCLCSLSCSNLFMQFSSISTKILPITYSSSSFSFIELTYPQVLISLDKPPIV